MIRIIVPNNVVFPGPYLSARPPKIGAPIPANKTCRAMDKPNNYLPIFKCLVIGTRYNPNP